MNPYYEHGGITIYHGNCREILPTLEPVDLVLTDPPYGIGESAGRNKSRSKMAVSKDYGNASWDDAPPDKETINLAIAAGRSAIVFGGNYFALPASPCWLVWDKDNGATDFADCELAWTNLEIAVRRIRWRWQGMLQEHGGKHKELRQHPTQKPLAVMKWCIEQAGRPAVICDPFMGSGTTGVAAALMGLSFIGIEREPKYFDIACRRIEKAYAQPDLFVAPPAAKPVQLSLMEAP